MKKILVLGLMLFPLFASAQKLQRISGEVLDQSDGSPLAGATIFIDPTQTQFADYSPQGTVADADGKFIFELPQGVERVMVSYIGYESQLVNLDGKQIFKVRLLADAQAMEAVVVTGYQNIEKRKVTSSISTVDMDQIKQVGVPSVAQMLEGQIAGIVSTPTNGGPGSASSIKVRTSATLSGTTEPLWVLDGIPLEGNDIPQDWSSRENIDNLQNVSIAGLNPDDIESITVLKDAAATAIYGARAANGVIVVTTKRGSYDQPMRVNATAALFVSAAPNFDKLNLMNATQKVDLELALAQNGRIGYNYDKGGVGRILDAANELDAYRAGGLSAISAESQAAIAALRTDGTNWADEIYRPTLNQQYGLNLSGGSKRATYYFSAGYYDEQGTTRGTGFNRLNLTLKSDMKLTNDLKFGVAMFYNKNQSDSYLSDASSLTTPSNYSRNVNPYLNAYNADGSYNYDPDMLASVGDSQSLDFNYLEEMENTLYELGTSSTKAHFDLEYKPLKGLRLYTLLGIQYDNSSTEKSADESSYYVRRYREESKVGGVYYLPDGGVIQNWNNTMNQYTWKGQGEYRINIAEAHEIDLMAGMEMRGVTNTTVHTKGFGYDSRTLVTTPIVFPNNSSGQDKAEGTYFDPYSKSFYENRYLSYYMTGSYTYDNRYVFFGSLRYDGTNLFGVDTNKKFDPMWSVSGAWNVNRESFLSDALWLNNLRLRTSYGVQGNIDRTTSPYIIGEWTKNSMLGLSEDGLAVLSPPNQNLSWERTYTWNAALDFSAFENRLNFTAEYYQRQSENLIAIKNLPTETGFGYTTTNFGETSGRGVELTLNTVNIRTNDFRWESTLTLAFNRDKVEKVLDDDNNWTPSLSGYPTSAIFAFQTAGLDDRGMPLMVKDGRVMSLEEFAGYELEQYEIWPGTGWYDYNEKMVNDPDTVKESMVYLGSRDPKATGGIINKFSYKNFDLSISANFVFKQLVTEQPFYSPTDMNPGYNYSTRMDQVWSPTNTDGIYPAITGSLNASGDWFNSAAEYDDLRKMYSIFNYYGSGSMLFNNLDIWTKEISYLRINSIRLGYTLPAKLSQRMGMRSVRLSVEARNPFVISSDYSGYFDPETYGNIYAQPLARTLSFGVNIGF